MSNAVESAAESGKGALERSIPAGPPPLEDLPPLHTAAVAVQEDASSEEHPPPLPPRPSRLESNTIAPNLKPRSTARPSLQSTATTAISRPDIHIQAPSGKTGEGHPIPKELTSPTKPWVGWGSIRRLKIQDGDESASIRSYSPTIGTGGDAESLLGDVTDHEHTSGWNLLSEQLEETGLDQPDAPPEDAILHNFDQEFEELDALDSGANNEGKASFGNMKRLFGPNQQTRGACETMEV
ncbi:MAG: hypothetical protein L6R41_003778 [Letrouitia leprolyta]|nr:MAG: hypothetical protein L6R41_003778 [Letrouitia leprolyta]